MQGRIFCRENGPKGQSFIEPGSKALEVLLPTNLTLTRTSLVGRNKLRAVPAGQSERTIVATQRSAIRYIS
jgi:hypothetical protein